MNEKIHMVYLCRKMFYWSAFHKNKCGRFMAKLYHLRILHKYNSWISVDAEIGT